MIDGQDDPAGESSVTSTGAAPDSTCLLSSSCREYSRRANKPNARPRRAAGLWEGVGWFIPDAPDQASAASNSPVFSSSP